MADSIISSLTAEDLEHWKHEKKAISHKKVNSDDNIQRGS